MATAKNDILKPLKRICAQIEAEENIEECFDEIETFASKGAFHEHHTFMELLGIVQRKAKLKKLITSEIFKFFGSILQDGNGSKDSFLCLIYNFLVKSTDRTDLLEHLIPVCDFKFIKTSSQPETIIFISEVLLKMTTQTIHTRIIFKNYSTCLDNFREKTNLSSKFLQSIYRTVLSFVGTKNYKVLKAFLEATLIKVILSKNLKIPTDEVFTELFAIVSSLSKTFSSDAAILKICVSLTEDLKGSFENGTHESYNEILNKVFNMCSEEKIKAQSIQALNHEHFQAYKKINANALVQKITLFVSKLLNAYLKNMDESIECFSAFHFLVGNIYHVFRQIESRKGPYPCCVDVKRHETNNIMITLYNFAIRCVKKDVFNAMFVKQLLYHVNYNSQICNQMKCTEVKDLLLNIYNHVYTVIFELNKKKSLIEANVEDAHETIKVMFKIWNQLETKDLKKSSHPHILASNVYEEASGAKELKYVCNGLGSLVFYLLNGSSFCKTSKETLKIVMKSMNSLHNSSKKMGFASATEFFESKEFGGAAFSSNELSIAELIVIEVCSVFRYTPLATVETVGKLYSKLFQLTKDPILIAKASQAITDLTLEKMNLDEFKKINKFLEKSQDDHDDIEISLALALNNYSIYYMLFDAVSVELKKDSATAMSKLELKTELLHLSYLNESLKHFTDVVHHIMQNPEDFDVILSMRRTLSILSNIGSQYFVRGIKYKDFEIYALQWHLAKMENPSNTILLNIGVFFMDHHSVLIDSSGNYIRTSKKLKQLTVDEIFIHANAVLDSCIATFTEQTEPIQAAVLSYLLSIWVYYVINGRKADGFKRYAQFNDLWKKTSLKDGSPTKETIHAKLYFSIVELNVKCMNRSADSFMSIACGILLSVKSVDQNFMFQFYQIYHRNTMAAINYSINRHTDMNHYDTVMLTMVAAAVRKGQALKVLDILSLSILRYLNMEKIDLAKTQLKDITRLIGLEEAILIETPTKFEMPTALFNYEGIDETVRKAAVAQGSPIQCELSMVYQDHSAELSRQIKSFVHEDSCKCEICNIPQLKFLMFQIGCHYARLMWLLEKFDVSLSFHKFAIERWRDVCDKLRRIKDCEFLMINKTSFSVFSIRWLFQFADTLIRTEKLTEVEEVYLEIELLLDPSIPDYPCFKQKLHCRKENLNFLLEHGMLDKQEPPEKLSFEDFLKQRSTKTDSLKQKTVRKLIKTPPVPNKAATAKPPMLPFGVLDVKPVEVVYIDLSDDETSKLEKPKPVKPTKKVIKETVAASVPKKTTKVPKPQSVSTGPKPSTSRAATSKTDSAPKPATKKAKPAVSIDPTADDSSSASIAGTSSGTLGTSTKTRTIRRRMI